MCLLNNTRHIRNGTYLKGTLNEFSLLYLSKETSERHEAQVWIDMPDRQTFDSDWRWPRSHETKGCTTACHPALLQSNVLNHNWGPERGPNWNGCAKVWNRDMFSCQLQWVEHQSLTLLLTCAIEHVACHTEPKEHCWRSGPHENQHGRRQLSVRTLRSNASARVLRRQYSQNIKVCKQLTTYGNICDLRVIVETDQEIYTNN